MNLLLSCEGFPRCILISEHRTAAYIIQRPESRSFFVPELEAGYLTDRPLGLTRNTGDAPKFLSFGLNISKAFFFEGAGGTGATRTNLNVFANITNAFNNVNFSPPSGVMTSPNFGLSTSAREPRLIEIGLRFQF